MESFQKALAGWPKRELHNAPVIDAAVADPDRVGELFDCVLDDDPYVRMRAADALEKVCQRAPAVVAPFTERVLREMAVIDQPSVQWHVAQIVGALPLTDSERRLAVRVVRRYLATSHDWIVLTCSMQALAHFAEHDGALRRALLPKLDQLSNDPRAAVAKRAQRLHHHLSSDSDRSRGR